MKSLKVEHSDGATMLAPGANLCLYMVEPAEEYADALLYVYQEYLEKVGKERFQWYLTNSMEKHRPITKRTFGMPSLWLTATQKNRKLLYYEIKSGELNFHSDAPEWKFSFESRSRDSPNFDTNANFVEFLFPLSFLDQELDEFLAFVDLTCTELPFICGHAGPVLMPSPYYEHQGVYDKALALSMRFPQFDISDPEFSGVIKRHGGIKSVCWINILSTSLASKLDTKAIQNSRHCEFEEWQDGLIIKAGMKPIIGDVNKNQRIDAFVEAYSLLSSLIVPEPYAFALSDVDDGEEVERTLEWMHRFSR